MAISVYLKLSKYIDFSGHHNLKLRNLLEGAKTLQEGFTYLEEAKFYVSPFLINQIKNDDLQEEEDKKILAQQKLEQAKIIEETAENAERIRLEEETLKKSSVKENRKYSPER